MSLWGKIRVANRLSDAPPAHFRLRYASLREEHLMRAIYRSDCPVRSKGMLFQVGQHPVTSVWDPVTSIQITQQSVKN